MNLYNLELHFNDEQLGYVPQVKTIIGRLDWENPDFIYNHDRTLPLPDKVITYGLVLDERSKVTDFINGHYGNIGHVISGKVKKILEAHSLDPNIRFIDLVVRHKQIDYNYYLFYTPYTDIYIDFSKSTLVKINKVDNSFSVLEKGIQKDELRNMELSNLEEIIFSKIVVYNEKIVPDFFITKTLFLNKASKISYTSTNKFLSEKLKEAFDKENITGVDCIIVKDHRI